MSDRSHSPQSFEPVSPLDIVSNRHSRTVDFSIPPYNDQGGETQRTKPRSDSTATSGSSSKSPRTARFAEATSVDSPINPTGNLPFSQRPKMADNQPTAVSDLGFGYVADNDATRHATYPGIQVEQHAAVNGNGPLSPPLKSALKTPGTPGRALNPLSPTFREEQVLEKHEKSTEQENARDVKIKTRVRMVKMLLRGVNFSCSLIVLSLLGSTFAIFNATKSLPARNNLPPWATTTKPWPQILLLVIACISLVFCLGVFYGYWKGGHKRAEKAATYYQLFALGFFTFNIIMWVVGAAVLQNSKANGNGKDIWGWSCKDNARKTVFQDDVSYALVCRMQNWSLVCCLIEVIIDIFVVLIYAVVFYRFYTKRRLRKSMDMRNKARSDLYLAQLRVQSQPNTPGFIKSPQSARFPGFPSQDPHSAAENGEYFSTQYASPKGASPAATPFQLQAPPIRIQNATPRPAQEGFDSTPPPQTAETVHEHVGAAPGEQTYAAVPIPGAYASPMTSPGVQPPQQQSMAQAMAQGPPGVAFTTDGRVESPPPGSPRHAPR